MLKPVTFCLFFSLSLCFSGLDYGPFNMVLNTFDVCSGPKKVNCSILTAKIIEKNVVYVKNKIIKNCNPSKGRIASTLNGKQLARFMLHKPCEHLFLRPLLATMYNISNVSRSCLITKGDYSARVDLNQIGSMYFGANFFYGNLTVKTYLHDDECNFSCVNLRLAMTPK